MLFCFLVGVMKRSIAYHSLSVKHEVIAISLLDWRQGESASLALSLVNTLYLICLICKNQGIRAAICDITGFKGGSCDFLEPPLVVWQPHSDDKFCSYAVFAFLHFCLTVLCQVAQI